MKDKKELRATLFEHLDGLVTAPTAYVLLEKGVLHHLAEHTRAGLTELTGTFRANEGYLNVALRVLASQGWLVQHIDNRKDEVAYEVTARGRIAFRWVHLYKDAVQLMRSSGNYHPRRFEAEPFRMWCDVLEKFRRRFGIPPSSDGEEQAVQEQIMKHIEGVLAGPTIVLMGMGGMFHKYFMESSFGPEEFHRDPESFRKILDFFSELGWFRRKNGKYQYTEEGVFFARRGSAYGVTVSYLPTFRKLDQLIFGDPNVLWDHGPDEQEKHVDREMNVWGSGGAHSNYFKVIDKIIIGLFDRPIEEQPKGILDMGCGNGAFLQHLFEVVERRTLRGRMLEEHPLFLVGADLNRTALKVTRANLVKADIWAKVIQGDIGRPDRLAQDLRDQYDMDLKDLLNVRTFLDHNRPWNTPVHRSTDRVGTSTGAFAFRGARLNNGLVEEDLLDHLRKWRPFVERFGLLVMELHTLPPRLTAQNLGRTAATAYDATHGLSDQYIVEAAVFERIASEAGLWSDPAVHKSFPDPELATVTIHLFKGAPAG